jgi:predicted nucleic acid-binding protein
MQDQPLVNTSIEMNTETVKSVNITAEDKERFFKSVLSDSSYEEIVPLFDGQLKLKFKVMTVQENTDVVNQIVADRKNGIADETDAYFITISTYRLALSLVSVDDRLFSSVTKENFSPSFENDTYVISRAKLMTSWTTSKLSAYLDAFQQFEAKTLKLTNEVQSKNFWKASA